LLAFSGAIGPVYDDIRKTFTYISCGERDPEVSGISAPVFGTNQKLVGAIGIVGPLNRLRRDVLEGLRPMILQVAAEATDLLGGDSIPLSQAAQTSAACSSTNITSAD
jgi:DNA-binding IclR family transcriptional regulator